MDARQPNGMPVSERGATAIVIAFGMIVLLGVAAVALDLSAGYNERNQDQTAGDNGVMAGAIDKADRMPAGSISSSALDFVRPNLTDTFTETEWRAMWRSCVDSLNTGWIPLPEPASWAGGPGATLDCISHTTSLVRVRIPDQLTDTTFGRALGAGSLRTHAISIAKVALQQGAPPVVPFGIGTATGHVCLSSSATPYPPCTGPETAEFGTLLSPLWGDFGTHEPACTGNSNDWLARNIAWGLDHEIEVWPGASSVVIGTAYPGKSAVESYPSSHTDNCTYVGGYAVPSDGIPLNTMSIDTGFPNPGLTSGLVSNVTFDGRKSRLQQGASTLPRRSIRDKTASWMLDNRGPWEYLLDDVSHPAECRRSTYGTTSGLNTLGRKARFEVCLASINSTTGPIVFDAAELVKSPRFVWVPQYTYLPPASGPPLGSRPMPIRDFRPAFIAGVWFNCSASTCGITFFPDETQPGELCIAAGPGCKQVSAEQLSAWMLPEAALPQSVFDDFDNLLDDREAELWE